MSAPKGLSGSNDSEDRRPGLLLQAIADLVDAMTPAERDATMGLFASMLGAIVETDTDPMTPAEQRDAANVQAWIQQSRADDLWAAGRLLSSCIDLIRAAPAGSGRPAPEGKDS